ncbi:hypothetical protein FA15DRAFT_663425 [Coprinopsis marcescibilis]|uniref:Transmembrane protein n=1 Tax=Coprinopsis marcescibilis TaxID=230819 RepID=A0A5C3LBA7_COPMA|nr:hypothetical protein FA15DRAFT_663425 [Coprinopsis marcescibilis]
MVNARTIISLVAFAVGATAQSTNVVCPDDFAWASNSLGQNPCLVSSYLQSACGSTVTVNLIPAGTHYTGPQSLGQATVCNCNTVVYSLTSACGACQGRAVWNWTDWSVNCTPEGTSIARFPRQIPDGTEAPEWAFLDVTTNPGETWDPVQARLAAVLPPSSSSVPIPQNTNTNLPPIQTSPLNPPAAEQQSTTNAGAIAGGVVGGLVFLVTVGLAVFWFVLRKKRTSETGVPSNFVIDENIRPNPIPVAASPPPMSQRTGTSPYSPSPYYGDESFDVRDAHRAPSVIQTTLTTRRSQESFNVSQFGSPQPRGYTGAAEV